jgi:hypothetical protein
MRVLALMLFALVSQAPVFAAAPADINGVAFGASEKDLRQVFPHAQCAHSGGDHSCAVVANYLSAKGTINYHLRNDRVVSVDIIFSPDDFDRVAKSMTERFGKPEQLKHGALVTPTGLTYENLQVNWHLPGMAISAQRFSGRIDESSVKYSTTKTDQAADPRKQEHKRRS